MEQVLTTGARLKQRLRIGHPGRMRGALQQQQLHHRRVLGLQLVRADRGAGGRCGHLFRRGPVHRHLYLALPRRVSRVGYARG